MQPPWDEPTTAVHRVTVEPPSQPPRAAPPGRALRAVPRSISAALLPGERVTFGSAPHPFVVARPTLLVIASLIAFGLAWQLVPAKLHLSVEAVGAVAFAAAVVALLRGVSYYLGFRTVATNRRIFVIRGILWRRVVPLANSALAASTLLQGPLGRLYGFGSVDVPQPGVRGPLFRDVRDPAELYRECQAVANGVDGDVWTPAVRQTIIP